jgi:hypothetical protein
VRLIVVLESQDDYPRELGWRIGTDIGKMDIEGYQSALFRLAYFGDRLIFCSAQTLFKHG